jgi:hypothetical protein
MIHWLAVAALIFAFTYEKEAEAAQSSVSVLYGDGYKTGEVNRHTIRFDTLAVKDWGMLYGRVDAVSFGDDNSNVFTRGIAHYGRGLHLSGQLQNQRNISQSSAGIGYSEFGKGSSWFVDFYRMSSNFYGDSNHAFIYADRAFGKYKINGFIEYIQPEEKTLYPITFSQISFSYKVSDFNIGVEHHRYFNKFGISGLDESVNQIKLVYNF